MNAQQIKQQLGAWIRSNREAKAMQQNELAQQVGLTAITVNRIENGHIWPSSESLASICTALDVSQPFETPAAA